MLTNHNKSIFQIRCITLHINFYKYIQDVSFYQLISYNRVFRYTEKSRDPERTPYQWDNSNHSGFSEGKCDPWLPVNENYEELNLAKQKSESVSHYKIFKALARLKKKPVIEKGSLDTQLYCYDCTLTENVLGVVRRDGTSVVALIVNFDDDKEVVIDVRTWLNIPEQLVIYAPSVHSKLRPGSPINMASVILPGAASVVFTTPDLLK